MAVIPRVAFATKGGELKEKFVTYVFVGHVMDIGRKVAPASLAEIFFALKYELADRLPFGGSTAIWRIANGSRNSRATCDRVLRDLLGAAAKSAPFPQCLFLSAKDPAPAYRASPGYVPPVHRVARRNPGIDI